MQHSDSRHVVERFLEAAGSRDIESMRALAATDLRVTEAASLPFGGVHEGLDAFLALTRRVFGMLEGTQLEIDRIIAEGEHVVVLARLEGRSRANGAPVSAPIAEIWRVSNGLVQEVRPYYLDTHALLAALQPTPS